MGHNIDSVINLGDMYFCVQEKYILVDEKKYCLDCAADFIMEDHIVCINHGPKNDIQDYCWKLENLCWSCEKNVYSVHRLKDCDSCTEVVFQLYENVVNEGAISVTL
ncbi:Adho107-like protein [Cryptophlebia peltastica nucleopolyhedrovirus]|uniref:Adho107-like protein n=1 Tax=Cryptophlebia peltastica nucleopolyhedrovirus TaxID=2304025 RepID=A0A346RNW3_9ABAC|nr:Adho107-like protein [Cryptophlebia peltastica nucleopolyhedrovirus]AXS67760.1 Adho107-like protein [Cryptophlebia peltastica nucleopolyhedrovirus]